MDSIKKLFGLVCIGLGLVAAYYTIFEQGLPKITSGKPDDLVFGIVILFVLAPIIVGGLILFGLYAFQGEYRDESA